MLHPGGRLGKKLLRVEDVMHTGDESRACRPTRAMKDVLFEMTRKRLGMTTVVDADGRARWASSPTATCAARWSATATRSSTSTAAECMTPRPA